LNVRLEASAKHNSSATVEIDFAFAEFGHDRMRFEQPLALDVAGHTTDGSAAVSPPIPAAALTSAPPGN
jgi:hypothetical protein